MPINRTERQTGQTYCRLTPDKSLNQTDLTAIVQNVSEDSAT